MTDVAEGVNMTKAFVRLCILKNLLAAATLVVCTATLAWGQSEATSAKLSGTVQDPNGASIPATDTQAALRARLRNNSVLKSAPTRNM